MVTTVTRALPRPARHTTALFTSVVMLVILSFPVTSVAGWSADSPPLPSHGLFNASQDSPGHGTGKGTVSPRERADLAENPMVTVGPPASTCDQRSVLRDLPDTVPSCALRLAVWDQPWWPLPAPVSDPVSEEVAFGELPPTRAPPPTANTAI